MPLNGQITFCPSRKKQTMPFYTNFDTELKKKGLTRYRFSKMSGIPECTVHSWKRVNPNIKWLKTIANTLGVTIDYLLDNDDRPQNYL